jgi:hypothetical protein
MHGNEGSVPFGNRSTDGDWISFREAVRMFATKEELEKTDRLLNVTVERVNRMPTREELEARWKYEDERNDRIEKAIVGLQVTLERRGGDNNRSLIGFIVVFVTIVITYILDRIGGHP